jgi:hypothetical protein
MLQADDGRIRRRRPSDVGADGAMPGQRDILQLVWPGEERGRQERSSQTMYSHLDTPPPKGVGHFVEKLATLGSILDADGVQSVTAPASKSQKPSAHSRCSIFAL